MPSKSPWRRNISGKDNPAKQQTLRQAFKATMRTADLFADMSVKAALTSFMQNAELN